MRAGTTCKNAACKAVSSWQGPQFAQPVLGGQEHHRCRSRAGYQAGGRWQCPPALYFYPVLEAATSVTSQPQSCRRLPDWWCIRVSLLLIACSEMQHKSRVGRMKQFPPALN